VGVRGDCCTCPVPVNQSAETAVWMRLRELVAECTHVWCAAEDTLFQPHLAENEASGHDQKH
jgi:hypothetical protein